MGLSRSRSWRDIARRAGRLFPPLRETLGFDARELTPTVVLKITVLAAETRSFERAAKTVRSVAGLDVSAKTIERVVHDVGRELEQRRDAPAKTGDPLARCPAEPPDLAAVECDGARIRTREPGHGPGVHRSGEGWREDKNACLIRAKRRIFPEDPQPEPPACFCDPKRAAKIAETEALSVAALLPNVREGVAEDSQPNPHLDDWMNYPEYRCQGMPVTTAWMESLIKEFWQRSIL